MEFSLVLCENLDRWDEVGRRFKRNLPDHMLVAVQEKNCLPELDSKR